MYAKMPLIYFLGSNSAKFINICPNLSNFFTHFCLIFGHKSDFSDFLQHPSQDYFRFWSHIKTVKLLFGQFAKDVLAFCTWFWAKNMFDNFATILHLSHEARQKWGFHTQLCFFWVQKCTSLTWNILLNSNPWVSPPTLLQALQD